MFVGSTAGISILGKLLRAEEKVLEKVATRMRKEIATKKSRKYICISETFNLWWSQLGSNQRPSDYESDALTD